MIDDILFALNFTAAIGCGLVAGIFFAFSSFVMAALARLPSAHGIAAMNTINVTVINRSFMLAFFGSALLCLTATIVSMFRWSLTGGTLVVLASTIYLAGCIGVTIVRNVPLNNALAAVALGTPQAAALWSRYLRDWTRWNTVRTVASAAAAILFTAGLVAET